MLYSRIKIILDKEMEMLYCENCGALIFDTDAHDSWHNGYSEVASSARHADMMIRPLGSRIDHIVDL